MLDITTKIKGDKVVIAGINQIASQTPAAVRRGLGRIGAGVHRQAYNFLSGSNSDPAGAYPVPVRSGHFRRHLNFLEPGQTKTVNTQTITAGNFETIIFNSAIYADVIFDGTGSSEKHGPRQYTLDALEQFNEGNRIQEIIEEEVAEELRRATA